MQDLKPKAEGSKFRLVFQKGYIFSYSRALPKSLTGQCKFP